MKKALIIIAIVVVVVWGGTKLLQMRAKSKSPEKNVEFADGDLKIHVFYNSPSKKGRKIFGDGGLEPYGKVWRTGANEPTYIETNKTLYIKGQKLDPGKYSVWTVPGPQTWQVIFNSDYPSWGIDYNGVANRNAETDVAVVEVPAVVLDNVVEEFTISVEKVDEEIEFALWWDQTLVVVPISLTAQ